VHLYGHPALANTEHEAEGERDREVARTGCSSIMLSAKSALTFALRVFQSFQAASIFVLEETWRLPLKPDTRLLQGVTPVPISIPLCGITSSGPGRYDAVVLHVISP